MNTRVEGGPYLYPDNDDTWDYFEFGNFDSWPHGLEIFPNLEGQYLHIVADYQDAPNMYYDYNLYDYYPKLTFCTVIVTGTRYIRRLTDEDQGIDWSNNHVSVIKKDLDALTTLSMSHIESELTIANQLIIDVRLKDTNQLAFIQI